MEYDFYVDQSDLDILHHIISRMYTRGNGLHWMVYCTLDGIYEL
jgi:hypothetical protein